MEGAVILKVHRYNFSWYFLGFLVTFLFFATGMFMIDVAKLKDVADSLNKLEYMSASVQRVLKLQSDYRGDAIKSVNDIDAVISQSLSADSNVMQVFEEFGGDTSNIGFVLKDWESIKRLVTAEPNPEMADMSADTLYYAGERFYLHTNNLCSSLTGYIEEISTLIIVWESILIVNIIAIAILVSRNFCKVQVELKRNQEIAKNMFVDSATGLFDRSKCQSLFKTDGLFTKKKSKALIIFDLNDLKKTNDTYGHKVGDDFIACFAQVIKEATSATTKTPFMGRYGGDEFMVYYSDVDQEEIEAYLGQLAILADEINANETKYKISYAVGYALTDADSEVSTFQELFDLADRAMYDNKIAIKRKMAVEAERIATEIAKRSSDVATIA